MKRSLFWAAFEAGAKAVRSGLSTVGALVDCGIPRQHVWADQLAVAEEDVEVWEPPTCGEHTGNCSNRCLRPPVHPGPHDDEPPTCSCYGPHTYGCMFHDALNYPYPQNSRTNAGATSNRAVEEAPEGARPPAAPSGALTSVLKVLAEHKPFEYAGMNTGYFWCLNSRGHNHATHGDWRWQDWCEHVAPLITEAQTQAAQK